MRSDEEYNVDPYGCAVADIKDALGVAMSNPAMSELEYDNLKAFEEHVRRIDNS